jgi:cyclopropane fatty-acyl-phospholipid synthase-like methyltransferase
MSILGRPVDGRRGIAAFLPLLDLTHQSHVLEVGCGSGGCALYPSRLTHAQVTGIDANASAIEEARFEQIDAIERVPLENASSMQCSRTSNW